MPMCSDPDAKCRATGSLIRKMYKCPFEFPCGECNMCDECITDLILGPFEWDDDDDD